MTNTGSLRQLAAHLPALIAIALALAGAAHGPIGQLANYHDFADHTVVFGIPHACDVMSNLGFALVALWGLRRARFTAPALACGRAGYRLFLIALLLTAFGSTWYHLAPDDARLIWDRIPIALACAGLLAAVRGETLRRDSAQAAGWLSLAGVGSVAWWSVTEQLGQGDLRPYLLLQVAPLVLVPIWQWLGKAAKADRVTVGVALLTYAIAKSAELNDHQIAAVTAPLTGHTLKHLLATAAAALIVARIVVRGRQQESRGDESC